MNISLWGWDDTNKVWVKLQVDANGLVKVDLSAVNLDDLADVNAPSPSNNDALTWDTATSKWIPETAIPAGHHASHENGGADEISVAALSGELADDQPPKAHDLGGTKHNADTLANLNAKVSDATLDDSSSPRDPNAHKTSHQNGGSDEINVAGLSGELADPQPAKAHSLGGVEHNADTLANLNTKVSDATLDDSGDPRDPNTHAASHQNGGSDEISVAGLSGELADNQPPKAHASSHEDTGADEISIAGLAGESAELATHKAATTGVHGAGTDHLALFGAASEVVSKVVWKDAPARALTDADRTVSSGYVDLDLTASTSSSAKFAILNLILHLDSYTTGRIYILVRKNGTTPSYMGMVECAPPVAGAHLYTGVVIVGLDTGQVVEYAIVLTGTAQVDSYIDVLGYIE